MEVDSIEDFFGPEAFSGLKENIKQQWEANRQRIDSLIAVRKVSYMACTQLQPWGGRDDRGGLLVTGFWRVDVHTRGPHH